MNGSGGLLVCQMAVDDSQYLGRPERFKRLFPRKKWVAAFTPGGRWCRAQPWTTVVITGRIDDVLNVSGHRTWVFDEYLGRRWWRTTYLCGRYMVSQPDDLTSEAIVAFVVLKLPARRAVMKPKAVPRELHGGWVGKQISPVSPGHSFCNLRPQRQDHAPAALGC
jgi:acetyl-CoA synthetase